MGTRSGIEFFPMETDVLTDDEKVFDLMEGYGRGADAFAAFGRWMGLLCRIYREGPALVLDGRMERKLARDLDMTRDELDAFLSACVDAGLLDPGMHAGRVLTSRGIQRRWCAAKKRKALPAEMAPYSLLESGQSREISETFADSPKTEGVGAPISEISENPRLDKKREEETRKEEKREDEDEDEDESSSVSGAELEGVPPCMATAREDGTCFVDDLGMPYATAGEALEQRYRHRTGLSDFPDFIRRVGGRCPASCRASPEQQSHCVALLTRALDRYEPARGSSPLPLALKIIEQDRGW